MAKNRKLLRTYEAKTSARLKRKNVQAYGEELDRLARLHDGVTPKQLVDEARNPKHVMHDEFEWNNDYAGELYRRQHARKLIEWITVKVIHVTGTKERHVPIMVSVVSRRGKRSYRTLEVVQSDAYYMEQAIADVTAGLRQMETKLRMFGELEKWADELKKYTDKLKAEGQTIAEHKPKKRGGRKNDTAKQNIA